MNSARTIRPVPAGETGGGCTGCGCYRHTQGPVLRGTSRVEPAAGADGTQLLQPRWCCYASSGRWSSIDRRRVTNLERCARRATGSVCWTYSRRSGERPETGCGDTAQTQLPVQRSARDSRHDVQAGWRHAATCVKEQPCIWTTGCASVYWHEQPHRIRAGVANRAGAQPGERSRTCASRAAHSGGAWGTQGLVLAERRFEAARQLR